MDFLIIFFKTIFLYPLFNLLMLLYSLFGDFGLSIILLTILTSLLLLPLTLRQLRTAKKLKTLQPQITALQQKHAHNRIAQNQAIRALHRQHGIHTGLSFLTMLIQIPIYSGLYFALDTALNAPSVAAINQLMYPFLVHFSTLPNTHLMWFTIFNTAWHFSLGLPDPTHLLPILTGLFTFLQMRITQPISPTDTRDALIHLSHNLQLLILLIPAAITILIAWHFAAGLALYRSVSLGLNILVQYFTRTSGSPSPIPAIARAQTTVSSSTHESPIRPTPSPRPGRRRKSSTSRHRGKKPGRGR